MHKRAHTENLIEKRGDTITIRGMRIRSTELGISGQCDIVECKRNEQGIKLENYDGLWKVCTVEYKHGRNKIGDEDRLQLCAQAICLEEMLLTNIPIGYLYYGNEKKRQKVLFDDSIRMKLKETVLLMHDLYQKQYT